MPVEARSGTNSFLPKQTSNLRQQPDRFVLRSPTRPLAAARGRRFPALPPLVRIDAAVVKRRPRDDSGQRDWQAGQGLPTEAGQRGRKAGAAPSPHRVFIRLFVLALNSDSVLP